MNEKLNETMNKVHKCVKVWDKRKSDNDNDDNDDDDDDYLNLQPSFSGEEFFIKWRVEKTRIRIAMH